VLFGKVKVVKAEKPVKSVIVPDVNGVVDIVNQIP
jgi:hypothetical protein